MGEPKKTRKNKDRLSNLPKELLHHILSLMSPDDARRTAALSRHWRSLWTTIPDFAFTYLDVASRYPCFERFITQVLDSRRGPGIRRFYLNFEGYDNSNFQLHHLVGWIRAAIECRAQEIDVSVELDLSEEKPELSLFRSETLTVLKFTGDFTFTPAPAPWLPSLKFLYLNLECVSDERLVPSLLSGCPALEELDINGFYRVTEIRAAAKLKKLSTGIQWIGTRSRFEIDAPSLEYLSIRHLDNKLHPTKFSIKNLDNVIEAQLFMLLHQKNLGCLLDLLGALSNVKYLYFSVFVQEDATTNISNHHRCLPEFSNLIHLRFGKFSNLDLLPSFLQKSPKLQVLIVERHDLVDALWTKPQEVPACLSSRLTHFTYKGFSERKEEFELVEYILRNSSALKVLTIQPSLSLKKKVWEERLQVYSSLEKKVWEEERLQIYGDLARLSELSKSCEFKFEKTPFHPDEKEYEISVKEILKKRIISARKK